MAKTLNQTPFSDLLPSSIAGDEKIQAAAAVLDTELAEVSGLVESVLIWSRLDDLSGPILDLLADQLSVDEWDPDWKDDQKRQVVKSAMSIHRRKGTPWAIEAAFQAVGLSVQVEEWFQYGGDPYKFRLSMDAGYDGLSMESVERVATVTAVNKNTRSELDGLVIRAAPSGGMAMASGVANALGSLQAGITPDYAAAGGFSCAGAAFVPPFIVTQVLEV